MHIHTPRGVRASVLAFAATGVIAGGLAVATPASATDTPTSTPDASSSATTTTIAMSTATAATTTLATAATTTVPVSVAVMAPTTAQLAANRATASPGSSVTFSGRVAAPSGVSVSGLRVVLQERRGSSWATVAGRDLSTAGAASFTVRPQQTVQHRLRFRGGPAVAAASSPGVTTKITMTAVEAKLAKVLAAAKSRTGSRYVFGAAGPTTFDCSGLTMYAYRAVGLTLPHRAHSQLSVGTAISRAQARPGDLVIFVSGGYGYHAGIYAGGGYMYDSPQPGQTVGLHKIWSSNVVFRRVV